MRLRKYGFECIVCHKSPRFWTKRGQTDWSRTFALNPWHMHMSQAKWNLIRRMTEK